MVSSNEDLLVNERFSKFLHERILDAKPSQIVAWPVKVICEVMIKSLSEKRRFSSGDFRAICERERKELEKLPLPPSIPKREIPERLAHGMCTNLDRDFTARKAYYSIARCMYPSLCPVYVLGLEFFNRLSKLDVSKVTYSVFSEDFQGLIKFPKPLHDDDGYRFDEVFVTISDASTLEKVAGINKGTVTSLGVTIPKEEISDRWLNFSWIAKGPEQLRHDGSRLAQEAAGDFSTFIPLDGTIKVSDTLKKIAHEYTSLDSNGNLITRKYSGMDRYDNMMNTIIAATVYILTGNPDLREYQNPVRYQSAGSSSPIKADKDLSRVPIHLVNYGWKKSPIYQKGVWNVEEFERIQPYGPGLKQTKIVTIASHDRRRRKPTLS